MGQGGRDVVLSGVLNLFGEDDLTGLLGLLEVTFDVDLLVTLCEESFFGDNFLQSASDRDSVFLSD